MRRCRMKAMPNEGTAMRMPPHDVAEMAMSDNVAEMAAPNETTEPGELE